MPKVMIHLNLNTHNVNIVFSNTNYSIFNNQQDFNRKLLDHPIYYLILINYENYQNKAIVIKITTFLY